MSRQSEHNEKMRIARLVEILEGSDRLIGYLKQVAKECVK